MFRKPLIYFLFSALSGVALADTVPTNYSDIYSLVNSKLSDFNNTLPQTLGADSTLYAPQLLMVNTVMADSFMKPGYYDTAVLTELQQIKATGAKAVTIHINFPIFSRAYHAYAGTDFETYATFYKRTADDIRARGMKVVVEALVGFPLPGSDCSEIQQYLPMLTWDQFVAGRVENAVNVANLIRPDYLSLLTEPDTEGTASGQQDMFNSAKTADLLRQMLQAVRALNLPGVKLGAGVASWSLGDPSWLTQFLATSIDYLDVHVYPVNGTNLQDLNAAADAAHAAGKEFAMSELWSFKVRDSELAVIPQSQSFARDVFSFWSPIDIKFLQTMVSFARAKQVKFVSPFWSKYFFSYLNYDDYSTASDADLLNASNTAAVDARSVGAVTDTGRAWMGMTLSAADTTPPATPAYFEPTTSATAVNLIWAESADNIGVAGYRVYRDGALVGTTAQPHWVDLELQSGITYVYEVLAFDASGNVSPRSTPERVQTIDAIPPSVPTNVRVGAVTSTSVDLSWTASSDNAGIKGYYILRGTSPSSLSPVGDVSVPRFTDKVAPTTAYYYAVKAYDQIGWVSDQSQTVPATTPADTTAPSTVVGLHVTASAVTSVSLAWSPATDNYAVGAYVVYRGTSLTSMIQIGASTTTDYTDAQAAPGTKYYYAITAVDIAANESPRSSAVTATTGADTVAPSAPSGLTASAVSSTSVNLSWRPATDNYVVYSYKIYRGTSASSLSLISATAATSFTDTHATPGTTLFYAVAAIDVANNEGPRSNQSSATTIRDPAPPSAPSALRTTVVTSTNVGLAWTASTDNYYVSSYKIYRGSSASTLALIAGSPTTTFNDIWAAPGKPYSYAVTALDPAGNESARSNLVVATTQPDTIAPTTPGGLRVTGVTSKSVSLAWSPATDNYAVWGYKIYRGTSVSSLSVIAVSTSPSYADSRVTPGKTYYYAISALDTSSNEGLRGGPIQVTTLADLTPPSAPSNLQGHANSSTSVTLSWVASTDDFGVYSYKVYRGTSASSMNLLAVSSSTSYTDTRALARTTYYYKITALDYSGNESAMSAPLMVTTP